MSLVSSIAYGAASGTVYQYIKKGAASWQNQQNDCAPSEDSDQPGHPPSLNSVFAVRSVDS